MRPLTRRCWQFQSTLPYGSDASRLKFVVSWTIFQSTLPYGSDAFGDPTSAQVGISIHAPLRERLQTMRMVMDRNIYFNPRSLTGATLQVARWRQR